MAHNSRIRAPGFWVALGVLDAAEMELVDSARYLAIHEGGGTWAITDNVVIGAAGAQTWHYTLPVVADDISGHVIATKSLTFDANSLLLVNGAYTLHGAGSVTGVMTVGAGGQVVVTSGREISVQSGGKIALAGMIDMTGTSSIAVGASADINVTGEVNVLAAGSVVFTDGGLIKGVVRLHSAATWYFTNGTTTRVLGAFKFDTGSTGSIESGVTFTNKSGGNLLNEGDLTNTGTYHGAGPEIMSGQGYRRLRVKTLVVGDFVANVATVDGTSWDEIVVPTALASGGTVAITSAGVPDDIRITVRRAGNADLNGCAVNVNGTPFFQFRNSATQAHAASVTFIMWSGLWQIDGYAIYSTAEATPLF